MVAGPAALAPTVSLPVSPTWLHCQPLTAPPAPEGLAGSGGGGGGGRGLVLQLKLVDSPAAGNALPTVTLHFALKIAMGVTDAAKPSSNDPLNDLDPTGLCLFQCDECHRTERGSRVCSTLLLFRRSAGRSATPAGPAGFCCCGRPVRLQLPPTRYSCHLPSPIRLQLPSSWATLAHALVLQAGEGRGGWGRGRSSSAASCVSLDCTGLRSRSAACSATWVVHRTAGRVCRTRSRGQLAARLSRSRLAAGTASRSCRPTVARAGTGPRPPSVSGGRPSLIVTLMSI